MIKHERFNGAIVPPVKIGQKVYTTYEGEVIEGVVRVIRPFIYEDKVIYKGNISCEPKGFIGKSKFEWDLYVVFEESNGSERVAYFTKEDAEKCLL